MKKISAVRTMFLVVILTYVTVVPMKLAWAVSPVHFYCTALSKGNYGSITMGGTTYQSGQTANYNEADYSITGNPPPPTSDWFFDYWSVMYIGSPSWVDNQYSQSTWFHLRGEAYLWAYFYSPIHTNSPTSPITWGTRQRITGTGSQWSGKQLSVVYCTQGSGMGPPNRNGVPPFGSGNNGYLWTTVTVNSGAWDTGYIYPTLPISLNQQLPQTYDVYALWGSDPSEEVDSNVVSFTLNPASAQIVAPSLNPSSIPLGESVTINDEVFSSAFVNSNDLTGTLTVQAKKQGTGTWIDVTSQSFTSTYGYSSVYGQYGDLYDLSTTWTPTAIGTYDVRVIYSGNHYYYPISSPPSSTLVVSQQSDFGISLAPNYRSVEGAGASEYLVTITSVDGFNSELDLTASASPSSDMSFSFSPTSVTPPPDGTVESTLQIITTSNTPLNGYTVTVTASGGGKVHSTHATLAVVPHSQYTIVFIPLNWQGDLTSFFSEVDRQANFLIDNVGVLTPTNTEIIKVGQNLQLNFDKDSPNSFNGWSDIQTFAVDRGFTGDRYVAITNEAIWGSVDGVSNWGHVVVVKQGAPHITAHELGHSWGLLDEYNANTWLSEAIFKYGYPIGSPPNSYPGDDDPPVPQGWSYGRAFDDHRCIMGTSNTVYIDTTNSIDRAFCPPHVKDEGFPVGVRDYEGCNFHVDNAISTEVNAIGGGLLRFVITFYRNGTTPTIHEVQGIGIVGKPDFCDSLQNFSMQIYSEEGARLYDSNITVSFWVSPSQSVGGDAAPFETDSVTVTWVAGVGYQQSVNFTLRDNFSNQTMISQDVSVPEILPDISIMNIIPYNTVIGQGANTTINCGVWNKGKTSETLNVTLYANSNRVGSQTISIQGAEHMAISFDWNTTQFEYGNYTITIIADIVDGETNTVDNNLTYGRISLTIPGDVNGDFTVNILDAIVMANHFNEIPGSLGWNHGGADADLNGDYAVNILDSIVMANHFNEHYP